MNASADLAGWRRNLLRYVHRLTGDPDLAEDIAQDALLRFVEVQGQRAIQTPRAWLYRVATNLLRDRARRDSMAARRPPPVESDAPPRPDQQFERKEAIRMVRAALERLPERDRELLMLRESGFRYREIAEILGVRTESVPTMAARALQRFRTVYRAETKDNAPD